MIDDLLLSQQQTSPHTADIERLTPDNRFTIHIRNRVANPLLITCLKRIALRFTNSAADCNSAACILRNLSPLPANLRVSEGIATSMAKNTGSSERVATTDDNETSEEIVLTCASYTEGTSSMIGINAGFVFAQVPPEPSDDPPTTRSSTDTHHHACIGGNVRRTCASVENENETTAEVRPSARASKRCSWEREREPSGEDVEPPAGSQTLAPRADASSKKPP
jgi:hypothetical protein